jgi:hypothetical protein
VGSVQRNEYYDTATSTMRRDEKQRMETTYQFNALAKQNPLNPNLMTAYDVVKLASDILVSTETIELCACQNVGVIRITDIRTPSNLDDNEEHEQEPSFDFTITYETIRTKSVQTIDRTNLTIKRV